MTYMNNKKPAIPPQDSLLYTAFFCEENIYHLGKTLVAEGFTAADIDIIFLSNANKSIALRQQQLQSDSCDYVVWDYHVILQLRYAQHEWIFDFDSLLDFPTLKEDYFQNTLIEKDKLAPELRPYARFIPLADYLHQFCSSRKHMLDNTGLPLANFPAYPPIQASNKHESIDLMQYIDMQAIIANSCVFSLYA